MDSRWESLRFPPPSLLLHAPRCCCCSELQPLFGACRGIQHPRGGRGVKIVPCSLLGPCFSLGLGRTDFIPPCSAGAFLLTTLTEDVASHEDEEGWCWVGCCQVPSSSLG